MASLVGQMAAALAATGSVTLASGALVLAGAVAAGQRRRMAEAVVLRRSGRRGRRSAAPGWWSSARSAPVPGVLAAGLGTLASWGVMHYVMRAPWTFLPGILAATVLGCIVLMLGFGYAGTESALRARAAPFLRNE